MELSEMNLLFQLKLDAFFQALDNSYLKQMAIHIAIYSRQVKPFATRGYLVSGDWSCLWASLVQLFGHLLHPIESRRTRE